MHVIEEYSRENNKKGEALLCNFSGTTAKCTPINCEVFTVSSFLNFESVTPEKASFRGQCYQSKSAVLSLSRLITSSGAFLHMKKLTWGKKMFNNLSISFQI